MGTKHLPDFPWDLLRPIQEAARQHPEGAVDLSIGTPVDSTPEVIQAALREHSDAGPYPTVLGTPALRTAMVRWCADRRNGIGLGEESVLATIGSKELVTLLPTLLGLGAGDVVAVPRIAYPSYRVGAVVAGASVAVLGPESSVEDLELDSLKLIWLNTPGNPHGEVLEVERLRQVVDWARQRDVIVVSDECYAELDWRGESDGTATPSILDARVNGGVHDNLLMAYSLSKQSNLAGYRAGIVAGDARLVQGLVQVRKHLGMMVPTPVQHAMVTALGDLSHVQQQRKVYGWRRDQLAAALRRAGFRIDHSEAGLYLWITREEDCWETAHWFAKRGIVVAPGAFYGDDGNRHVRVGLTATDTQVEAACARL
jgi:succinyldiaminopimelate transaminase